MTTQLHTFDDVQAAMRPMYDVSKTAYTLDTMRTLMNFLDNPQNKVRVVHVAGTSGKTSTAYYCAALLRAAGQSVGLSVSPHVDTINECVQINGTPLSEAEFCAKMSVFLQKIADAGVKPSYFECMVAMAYWCFAEANLDYAVMEVGLGGLLDGTNVVDRDDKVCVITDIGLDHTEILGDTVAKITAQKAGIIQPYNQVFAYQQSDEIMQVIREVVNEQQAELHVLNEVPQFAEAADLPAFQNRNLGLAAMTVSTVLGGITSDAIQSAAAQRIPARLERLAMPNNVTLVLDGSHNQQKMQTLFGSLMQLFPDAKPVVLCGFVDGPASRWEEALAVIARHAERVIVTTFASEKDLPKHGVDPVLLAQAVASSNVDIAENPAQAYELLRASGAPLQVVTGSFYLMNHIRPSALKEAA